MKYFKGGLYMKQLIVSFIFILSISFTFFNCSQAKEIQTVDQQMSQLLLEHQKYLNRQFKSMSQPISSFERNFFINMSFMKDNMTQNFFHQIKSNIENGRIPGGLMQVSYTKYVSINGKFTGVHYAYKSDGKNITLTKSTNQNGKMLKSIYNYNQKGKLLKVQHFDNNKLRLKKEHTIKI